MTFSDSLKTAGDVAAGSIAIATLVKWLPAVAAMLSIVWTLTRLWDWVEGRWFKK